MNEQQPSQMPFQRYQPFVPFDMPDRTWPEAVITTPRAGAPSTCVTATRH